ncbi:MAG: phosphoenolpyruvate carboxykinase (ATP), partial [Sediminibacterium sp.]|nr:phosphoenolpyruvate carboxykinase (ATP) [Sediminibacterium sp.]
MSLLDSLLQQPIQPTAKFLHNGIHYQLTATQLVQATLERGQGELSDTGALCISTGKFTGRSPKDKFIVRDAITTDTVNWNNFNQPISEHIFLQLREKMLSYA